MDLLAYWRWDNYTKDLDEGAGFNFNSNQKRLHSEINIGERLWLVTGKPDREGIKYILVAKLVVIGKTFNHPDYKYGKYRVWGDVKNSAYFSANGPALSELLLRLKFISGKLIQSKKLIGQSLQTIRVLNSDDSNLFVEWCKSLSLEPRAYQIVDEELLEKSFESGENDVREAVTKYHIGPSDERKSFLKRLYRRNRRHIEILQDIYAGRCQLCAFDPKVIYGVRACYGHHIVYLSRGGLDELENLLLICPNHHEIIHSNNAIFDFYDLCYAYPNGRREPLVINQHLKAYSPKETT